MTCTESYAGQHHQSDPSDPPEGVDTVDLA
jgi:hypothetical protein